MNLRWLVVGHLRGLAQRWTRTLLLVVAVAAGVSLAIGVLISQHSLDRSLALFTQRITGNAALRVEGPADHGSLDASVIPKVAAVPGVKAAVPLIVTIAQAADSSGHEMLIPALGVDCGIQEIVGAFDCTPELIKSAGDTPLLAPALHDRLGEKGEIRTDLGAIPSFTAPAIEELKSLNHGLVAVFELGAAQRQFVRPGGVDEILVVPNPGVDPVALRPQIQAVIGAQNHVVAADAPIGSSIVASLILPLLGIISLVGLVIGGQLVRNTLDLSLEERRRELATTAALGAAPRTLMIGLLTEGLAVGLLGGLGGIVGGTVVARLFVGALSDQLAKATGLRIAVSTPASVVVISIVVGVLVSLVASIPPARRAARLDLVAELSERARYETPPRRSALGLAVTGVAAASVATMGWLGHRNGSLEPWQPILLSVALAASAIVAFVACAQLTPRLLNALRRAPGFSTGPARVALTNIVSARRRTSALALAIAAPVFLSTVVGGIVPGLKAAAKDFPTARSGGVFVSTLGVNNTSGIDSKLTPDLATKIAAVPGVARLDRQYWSSVDSEAYSIMAIEGPAPDYPVYRGIAGERAFALGQVMLGPGLARRHHYRPGDTIAIPGRSAPAQKFVVGGIWGSAESVGFSVTMRSDQLLQLYGNRPADNLVVRPAAGVSTEALADRIRAAHIDRRLIVLDPAEMSDALSHDFGELASPVVSLQYTLVLVALVATASTLLLAAEQRRRDNAVLAALGMSPADLGRSTLIETVLTALGATITAAFCAQLTLLCFTWASALATGLRIPYRFAPGPVVAAALAAAVIAVIGALLPAWRTARTNVMTALRTA